MKYTLLTIALLFALAVMGGYAFLATEINTAISSIEAIEAEADSVLLQESLARAAQRFALQTKTQQAELDAFMVHDADVLTVIETIEALAKQERVTVSIAPLSYGSATWKRHEPIIITVSAEGSFAAVIGFIAGLETLPRVSRLDQFGIERTSTGWFGTFEISFVKEKI